MRQRSFYHQWIAPHRLQYETAGRESLITSTRRLAHGTTTKVVGIFSVELVWQKKIFMVRFRFSRTARLQHHIARLNEAKQYEQIYSYAVLIWTWRVKSRLRARAYGTWRVNKRGTTTKWPVIRGAPLFFKWIFDVHLLRVHHRIV